ncbi:class D sortase [Terrisporobacter sp.]|uniref:class D sortase n=1 Tax=Terrisporobacter sp. TaxID=1965305 RepID=UPI00262770C9|nr:class D sortase [Terrisporobacter sp.]
MRNKISRLLILMGLLVLIGSLFLILHFKSVENRALISFEEKIEKNEVIENVDKGDEIGIIEIKSINLKNVIVESIENKYLRYYICHFENSAMPGEDGNFALAGHSSTYFANQVFNELHKVEIGDEIKIKTINDEFIYTITETSVIEPEDTYVLEQDMSKKEITIITCTNSGKQRFLVKGEIK